MDTVSFDEKIRGWTSFHSYEPESIVNIFNNLYTFKNGQLYIHNSDSVSRNNFYGQANSSKIDFIFNDLPENVKSFKTINMEGNKPWSVALETNLTQGSISSLEFINKEDEWYSYIRRDESALNTSSSLSVQGLGSLASISSTTLTFNNDISPSFNIGDVLYRYNSGNSSLELIGTSLSKDEENKVITVDSVANLPFSGDFIVSVKNSRIESSLLKGYYLLVRMTVSDVDRVELFAVSTEIFRSFE